MQLTQLEIKGFKSFGDKITIRFDAGVTAIAGPNGCGKSNVVDAIRWVLGEQSTRMLRSEKMENIIFNGSKTRKASNLAEVSLSFDNTRNILPTEFSHITLTRKLYRTGESEYRLNDVQCRLKDITDLFLDTGIGPDSYAIIELKMIEEIIANKENSRRALFEEASGISKYKLRKKQTYARLNDTETDLSRVDDLLFEIEKNLKTLENQAKKTERYFRIKEQYKAFSIALASYRIDGFRKQLQGLEASELQQATEKTAIVAALDKLEADIQQQKTENLTQEKNLSVQQKAANEFIAKIRAFESDKKVKQEQLSNLHEKEQRLAAGLEAGKSQLEQVKLNLNRLNDDLLDEDNALQAIQLSLDIQKQEVAAMHEQLKGKKEEQDELAKQSNDLQSRLYQAEKNITVLYTQKEALTQESTRSMADAEARETELGELEKQTTTLNEKLQAIEKLYNEYQQTENQLQLDIQQTTARLDTKKEEMSQLGRTLDALQNEYSLTKSMVDNLEGFPESIRFLKKNAGWAQQASLLSDILFCREEYRIAIEKYLEPVLNYYVVQTRHEAVQGIHVLADATKGRANFFILDDIIGQKNDDVAPATADSGQYLPALDIIECDNKYLPLCRLLLQNVYLLPADDDAAMQTPLPGSKAVLLSRSGKFSKSRISMGGGSVGLFEGKRIGRMKNLDNLLTKLKSGQEKIDQHKAETEKLTAHLAILKGSSRKQEAEKLLVEIGRINNELISTRTKHEQFNAYISNNQNRKQAIEEKIEAIDQKLEGAKPRLALIAKEKESTDTRFEIAQRQYADFAASVATTSAAYNQEIIRYHQQLNKISGIKKDIAYLDSQQKNLAATIQANQAGLLEARQAIQHITGITGVADEDLAAMYIQKDTLEKGLTEAEDQYFASRGSISELESQLSVLRKNKEHADVLTVELKDQKTMLRMDLNALKERLSVEFSVDITGLIDAGLPAEDVREEEVLSRTQRLKKQLDEFGAINPMALEAYQEMNERFTFIQAQKKDLVEAKTSLLETIKEIDDTASSKFMSAFTEVRAHFISVFRSLFNEEDTCDLLLTEPENPLESDIEIMAKPKGKRPLSINQLSGGEKTLTATALLFSLYLLKPAPFCIFDEVDAPLDDTNIDKFNTIIRRFSNRSQFIIVSHNKRTIASTDIIYGVTMVEQGVSKVVAVDMREVVD